MKNKFFIGAYIALFVGAIVLLIYPYVFGNKRLFDTKQTFDRAIIKLQSGEVVECEVDTWLDYEGEQMQIESTDGTIYLTSSYNCTLIKGDN